jgi:cell division protein FtsQ
VARHALALGCGAAVLALIGGAAVFRGKIEVLIAEGRWDLAQETAKSGFRLTDVRVAGASPQATADILKAADLQIGGPSLALDLDAVRRRVEQVGWVKSARIIRLLPGGLLIDVTQRQLVAVWQHAGRTAVVDAQGVAAPEADPAKFASLPLVVGEGANTAAAAILPSVLSRPRLVSRLEALVRVDDRRWDLRLKDGSIIQLPETDEEAALMRLDALDRAGRILDLGVSRVDLRDPEMVAVRPRRTDQAAAPTTDGAG